MATQINPVYWFEIPVNDLDRAKKFYESVLGYALTLEEMGPAKMAFFPMVNDVYGTTGTLIKMEGYTPSHAGILVYFSVEDIEGTLDKVNASGAGRYCRGQDRRPRHGAFRGQRRNRVGIHSMK
jgi:predicted enzyme related to lactoylglutathione lyase